MRPIQEPFGSDWEEIPALESQLALASARPRCDRNDGRRADLRERSGSMEFTFTLGLGAWLALIVAAVLFGVIAQFIGETRTGYEWLVDGIAFAIGAIVASEFVIAFQTFEPVWDGLALVPALIGGLVLGIAVELVTRVSTGGRYTTHQPMSA
jgi:uncharacterized membrane protein YeaQ/YmgE (transglycosylase-associated protein family)